MTNYDLNKLLRWAKRRGVSLYLNYCEPSDELEIETGSAAKGECYYMKRCSNVNNFIDGWEKRVRRGDTLELFDEIMHSSFNGASEFWVNNNDFTKLKKYMTSLISQQDDESYTIKDDYLVVHYTWNEIKIKENLESEV